MAPYEPTPSPCPDCGDPILWRRTKTGRLMPIDADPVPNGNLVMDAVRVLVQTPEVVEDLRAQGVPLRQHHRLSCVHADAWAQRGKRG